MNTREANHEWTPTRHTKIVHARISVNREHLFARRPGLRLVSKSKDYRRQPLRHFGGDAGTRGFLAPWLRGLFPAVCSERHRESSSILSSKHGGYSSKLRGHVWAHAVFPTHKKIKAQTRGTRLAISRADAAHIRRAR
ncbi:unnamed protein product [Ectocarpus sp. 4 AP-2014]